MFLRCGRIEDIRLDVWPDTGEPRNFAFVQFSSIDEAVRCFLQVLLHAPDIWITDLGSLSTSFQRPAVVHCIYISITLKDSEQCVPLLPTQMWAFGCNGVHAAGGRLRISNACNSALPRRRQR